MADELATLSASLLRELLDYDPATGVFTWRVTLSNVRPAGSVAGTIEGNGYCQIQIARVVHKAHRLAWLYVHGEWPQRDIDHKNGNRADNRIANLRPATRSQNLQNQHHARSDSRCGLQGVSLHQSGRWRARIQSADGKRRHLGFFDSPQEAHAAYLTAKRELHPFASTGGS